MDRYYDQGPALDKYVSDVEWRVWRSIKRMISRAL
jgi:hypothetical protein